MLDADTKRRIDTARDTLVGKVPDPKSQVEQITIALIYKFMDDIDAESEELGGQRKFFAGDFARYGWPRLVRAGLGGHEVLNLYAEAISRMPENPGIPALFRDIFNNAYLPYRDPETLRAFLKVIDTFTYDHSERLGDAFEYLLSVLGSQGDAGQFRTPRHIIDFMVAILDPKKDETVLDPACGTAGFLVSSYKHILKANTDAEGHSTLTPDEKAKLAANFKGYDISPDMVRLSLVNLYLHGFVEPHVVEYDTLTSEERWNEYADVILANPPFMSPKGGIRPHRRFSVQSKRSEVLFVDYMAEHLTPTGRAGIIVPEGIIFQSQSAHKQLRKMLVENYLVAVISLPSGVFQPYSGVKTSILILDKTLAKKADRIAFFKVEKDGFGLGAQRRAIAENDLPQVQAEIVQYLGRLRVSESVPAARVAESRAQYATNEPAMPHGMIAEKEKITGGGEYNLSGERYRESDHISDWPMVALGEITEDIKAGFACGKGAVGTEGVPHIRPMNITEAGQFTWSGLKRISDEDYRGREGYALAPGDILFNNTNSKELVGKTCHIYQHINGGYSNHITRIRVDSGRCVSEFVASALHAAWQNGRFLSRANKWIGQAGINTKSLSEFQIPLPPVKVQREIIAEIRGYQLAVYGTRMLASRAEKAIWRTIGSIWNGEQEISSSLYGIPSGLEHVEKMVVMLGERNRQLSGSSLSEYESEINVLGISLSILYQVATCHRKCFGGGHVLESLTGRAYNLACSSYVLICRCLYDEALNLIRSMGEISNLILLFYGDNEAIESWLKSNKISRLSKFGPSKVRESLEKQRKPLYADRDWYAKFCEDYTHVHPGTRPNVHNKQNAAFVGGVFQEEGLKYSIGELTNVCTHIAMFMSKYGGLDDLFNELCEALEEN